MTDEQRPQVKIRKAKPYDVSNLCRLLEQAVFDGEGFYPVPNEYLAINWVTSILNEGYVVVAEKAGRLIGTIAITNYHFPWSHKRYLYVDWMFVSKKFREGKVFSSLLAVIHDFADEENAPIFGGIQSGKDSQLKDRMMQMKGYHYLGGQFMRLEADDDGQRIEEDDSDLQAGGAHPAGRENSLSARH